MNCSISFAGITRIQGSPDAVKETADKVCDESLLSLHAISNDTDAVVLSGKDMEKCAQEKFGIEISPEVFACKSKEEAETLYEKEPEKFTKPLQQLNEAFEDMFGYIKKVFSYYDEQVEKGVDAEGNPIKEIKC